MIQFNAKLEEQRIAGRLSIAQAEGAMGSLHTGARSKSLAPIPSPSAFPPQLQQQHHQQQPSHPALKKKASLPSLAGQGYTFGSGAAAAINGNGKPAYYDAVHPSPFSETPPSRGGGSHNNNGYHHPSASSSSRIAGAAVPSGSPSTGGIMWNRPFPAMHGGSGPRGAGGDAAGGPADIDMQHEDEEDAAARLSEGRDRLGAISPGNRNGGSGGLPPLSSSASPSAADNGIPQGYNLGRRTSVSAESIDPNSLSNSAHSIPKVIIPKTPSQRARIESSTEKNLLFRNLDEEQHNDVVNAMKEVQVTQGTEVIVQGAVGDFFYVVESGDFQIWVKPQSSSGMVLSPTLPSSSNNNARGRSVSVEPEGSMKEDMQATTTLEDGSTVRADGSKLVATITSGGSFGELALMYNAPRAATVVCSSENATLWALDRVTFRTILMEHTSKKRRMYEQFLSEVPILVSLEGYERSKIADALEERIYEEGEDVVREGELGKNFYIIESGKAEVLKRKEGGKQERVGTLTKGDYFGGEQTITTLLFLLTSIADRIHLSSRVCRTRPSQLCS